MQKRNQKESSNRNIRTANSNIKLNETNNLRYLPGMQRENNKVLGRKRRGTMKVEDLMKEAADKFDLDFVEFTRKHAKEENPIEKKLTDKIADLQTELLLIKEASKQSLGETITRKITVSMITTLAIILEYGSTDRASQLLSDAQQQINMIDKQYQQR